MKHKNLLKPLMAVLIIAGVLTLNVTNVEADITPAGTVDNATVYGRTTCNATYATASTYTSSTDYGVYCTVSAQYCYKHNVTGKKGYDYDNAYGYSSTTITFSAPNSHQSCYVDADHSASKNGDSWYDDSYEDYP